MKPDAWVASPSHVLPLHSRPTSHLSCCPGAEGLPGGRGFAQVLSLGREAGHPQTLCRKRTLMGERRVYRAQSLPAVGFQSPDRERKRDSSQRATCTEREKQGAPSFSRDKAMATRVPGTLSPGKDHLRRARN